MQAAANGARARSWTPWKSRWRNELIEKDKTRYGWVMVALGAFMTCIAIGAMFSLAVFLRPITEATGWSHTEVSSAMTIGFLAMGAAGFGWGALSDRIRPRPGLSARARLLAR